MPVMFDFIGSSVAAPRVLSTEGPTALESIASLEARLSSASSQVLLQTPTIVRASGSQIIALRTLSALRGPLV